MPDSHGLAAPDTIAPIHSLFGVLVSESEKEASSTFLLVRQLPIKGINTKRLRPCVSWGC